MKESKREAYDNNSNRNTAGFNQQTADFNDFGFGLFNTNMRSKSKDFRNPFDLFEEFFGTKNVFNLFEGTLN